jgi:hypothetical protein
MTRFTKLILQNDPPFHLDFIGSLADYDRP